MRDADVGNLLAIWEQARAKGQTLSLEELCHHDAELIRQLRERIETRGASAEAQAPTATFQSDTRREDATTPVAPQNVEYRASVGELRFHARGGLGVVFAARDRQLDREVAVKLLREERANEDPSRQRFRREAALTGALEHPGIVSVHGVGETDSGQPFYVMRFIGGENLTRTIDQFHLGLGDARRQSLQLRGLLRHLVAACNALEYAHSRGIVHRDVKPQNIMVGDYGETLLVDWGLAKRVGGAIAEEEAEQEVEPDREAGVKAPLSPSAAPADASLTEMGEVMGTPAYMSPEQASGDFSRIGPASDVYGLGATLFHILTGRPPVQGTSARDGLAAAAGGDIPRPRTLLRSIPRSLEAVCMMAMAPRIEDRYPSPGALAADLEAWLADESVTAYPETPLERSRRWLRRHRSLVAISSAAAAVVLLILSVSVVLLAQANQAERQARGQAEENFSLATRVVDQYLLTISGDERLRDAALHAVRAELADAAGTFYRGLIEQQADNDYLRQQQARAHFQLGKVYEMLDDLDRAESEFEKATSAFTALHERAAADTDLLFNLAVAHGNRGTLLQRRGNLPDATAALRESIDWHRQVAEMTVADPAVADEYAIGRALDLENLAVLLRQQNQIEESLQHLQTGLELLRSVVERSPTNALATAKLASALNSLAGTLLANGRLNEAEAALLEATDLRQRLLQESPESATLLNDYRAGLYNLGAIYVNTQRWEDAEQRLRVAERVGEQLVQLQPGVEQYRLKLVNVRQLLAMLYQMREQKDEAHTQLEQIAADLEGMATNNPDNRVYQVGWVSGVLAVAQSHGFGDRTEQAAHTYQQARTAAAEAVAANPSDRQWQQLLGEATTGQADMLCRLNRPEQAEPLLAEAREIWNAIHRPGAIDTTIGLATTRSLQGYAALLREDDAATISHCDPAIEMLLPLVEQGSPGENHLRVSQSLANAYEYRA